MRRLLALKALHRPGCDPDLGLCHRQEPLLPAFDLGRQAHAIGDVCPVGLLRQGQQFLYFVFELRFDLLDVPMRERAVARGVGVNLGAIQADGAQLQQLHLLRQFQHLHKNARQFVQKTPPEPGQGVMIRVAPRRNESECHQS
jgi:hypothetical protein